MSLSMVRAIARRTPFVGARAFGAGPIFGPGTTPGASPTDFDQATGREREEMIANSEGNQIWGDHIIEAAFGTESNPVKVPSAFNERVVGCTGGVEGGNKHHEVQWFNLKAGAIHKVMPSGQCFVLVKPEDM